MPTFAEYIPKVADAVSPGTARIYGSYWKRIVAKWGPRSLLDPSPDRGEAAQKEDFQANAVVRRNSRGGRGTAENFIAALRLQARRERRTDQTGGEPGGQDRETTPPRLHPARARGRAQMSEINYYAGTTGDDPVLDTLPVRLHTESAC